MWETGRLVLSSAEPPIAPRHPAKPHHQNRPPRRSHHRQSPARPPSRLLRTPNRRRPRWPMVPLYHLHQLLENDQRRPHPGPGCLLPRPRNQLKRHQRMGGHRRRHGRLNTPRKSAPPTFPSPTPAPNSKNNATLLTAVLTVPNMAAHAGRISRRGFLGNMALETSPLLIQFLDPPPGLHSTDPHRIPTGGIIAHLVESRRIYVQLVCW